MLNSRRQGNVGIGSAVAYFTSIGATVSIPLTDSQEYDLVVDIKGTLKKVQVKTSIYKRDGRYEVHLATRGGNQSWSGVSKKFNPDKVDELFILTGDGKRYCIPTSKVKCKTYLIPGVKYRKYRVKLGKL